MSSRDLPGTEWPRGGGETGALIRAFDWGATSLGPIATWPQSLKTATDILLQSPVPIVMLWGPEGVMIYNDGYSVFAGGRHPALLGSRVLEGWPEVADFNANVMKVGLAGGTLAYRKTSLILHRHGAPEEVFLDLDYSPVLDESGEPAGVLAIVFDITERVRADERLQIAQRAGRVGAFEWYPETGRLDVSDEYRRIWGFGPEVEVTQDLLVSLVDASDRGVTGPARLVGGGNPLEYSEYRITRPDTGEVRWLGRRGEVLPAEADRPPRYIGVSFDITDMKLAEAALRESEEQFRTLTETMPGFAWSALPTGALNYATQQWLAYSGLSLEQTVADGWLNAIHPDDLQRVAGVWTTCVATGDPYNIEFRLRRHDATYRWFLVRGLPVRDEAGAITRWVGAAAEVEEIVEAREVQASHQQALEEEVETRTRERDRIWNVSRDLLLVTDSAGLVLSANPAWITILGWSEVDLAGRTTEWLQHPEDRERTRVERANIADGQPTQRFENRFLHRDGGYRWLSWTAVADEGLIYCLARDITADKEAQARLRETEEALRQAQKMEAVGQLTGGIAHDFNNLLTGIIGSLDLIQRRIDDGRLSDLGRFMEAATTSAGRAAALTHRLLAFARRQSLDPKAVDVNGLVDSMGDLLRRTLGEQVELAIALAPDAWPAFGDSGQLENAVLNLAINARDAMPGGGKLTIETANTHLDLSYTSRHEDLKPGDYTVLSVTDTGVGMTPEVIAKAFDPFFTTKPIGQGTGLGLSMIYGFARQSGGHARIYSEVGQGSTVRLYLPRFTGEAPDGEADQARPDLPRGAGETVLVVEDDPAVRLLVVEVLSELGYAAIEAHDGPAALPILESDQRIDLMVSDVGLPGLNGRQVAEIGRQHRPGLKVLFVTGYAENAAVRSGFLDPEMEMITKPFALDQLAAKIREMIER
ncbi:MAG: PAS domain S-box protein [Phenylobacterium sp.]|uniref:hybrid sensor histidine kinase/response regulator n=1 Tax=Phenylobacterium sp. TaxID=1871053 RepID=UPI00272FF743|nr:PAS domain S-box protein [Phenylobacterium sp.]MDP2011931.1 PAS domain S-box protein [Phenylobacterium sp.]MDP3870935.1 PAS domain S-box protein [Phenylobacterium sp.]